MADEHKTDIVMKFVTKENAPVNAECALDKDKSDTFMKGFNPQTYDTFSNFFEVATFSFGFEIKDESESNKEGGAKKTGEKKDKLVTGDFVSWRTGTDDQAKKVQLQLEFRSFKFERLIDAASAIFFQHILASKSFASATLVKRVSVGGDKTALGYLRMDFFDVLITSLDWDDGEMTKEKCEFICKKFTMQYRPQNFDGSLDQPVTEVTWKQEQVQPTGNP
jgi:type VI protein secretion system component Hcp